MPHLSEFVRNTCSYTENDRRFCIRTWDRSDRINAYNIDVSGRPAASYYFATIYKGRQGLKSADGIYTGSFAVANNRKVNFALVIELEGSSTSFDDAVNQVKATIEHFCKETNNAELADDGMRHHRQAEEDKNAYGFKTEHIVAGLVIGSSGRQGQLKFHKSHNQSWPIICINSRQPTQDKTAKELFLELAKYTGKSFW